MLSSEPTRVGYVVKRYPRYSETFIVNEVLAHEAAGLELDLFALRPPVDTHFQDPISRVRAPVHYLPAASLKAAGFWELLQQAAAVLPDFWSRYESALEASVEDAYQAVCLALEVHRRQISHLHAHFATSPASVARLAARLTGIPFSFTAHAKDIFHESVSHDDLACKLADARAVITVSQYNVDFLRRTYGREAANVRCIYNGLDLDAFAYRSPRDRRPLVVAVGRLVPKKGFSVLVDACHLLKQRGVMFTCRIIGCGELEETLRHQIDQRRLQQYVELVGPQPQREVMREVQQASVFAAPCVVGDDGNRDGLPTVLLEAMALGTPCVSTDVTGIPEVVRQRQTGLLVAQHDPGELAEALRQLLVDPSLRLALAQPARKLIEHQFNVHHNAARVRDLIGVGGCRSPLRTTSGERAQLQSV